MRRPRILTRPCLVALVAAAVGCGRASVTGDTPGVVIASSPTGGGIVELTRFTFTAQSTGLGGGPPAYAWDFGDGSTATGVSVDHVFTGEGTFNVAVTANGGGRPAAASTPISIRSLTGTWSRPEGGPAGFGFSFALTQRGSALDGEIDSPSLCPSMRPQPPFGTLSGTVTSPRSVQWTLVCGGTSEFVGVVGPDLNSITGSYASGGGPVTYSRSP